MKKAFKKIVVRILVWEAKAALKKYKPKIIVVTGSVGKTSTKDAIYTVLSSVHATRKSEKSLNSEIGVPLTILGCRNAWSNPFLWIKNIIDGFLLVTFRFSYPEWLVLEVGADKPGDIRSVAEWLKPNVSVITRFGDVPVHVEFFPSIEDLVREKGSLTQALVQDGIFVYNGDDRRIQKFAETIQQKKVRFGLLESDEVRGSDESFIYGTYENSETEYPIGISCKINYLGSSHSVNLIGTLGRHHMYPLLAAFAVGVSLNIPPEKVIEALKTHASPRGRMKLVVGIKDTLLVDDTYNSSPVAVHEALHALHNTKSSGKKIAVLGDMLELGQYSVDEHKRVGEAASKTVDMLVTVGIRSRAVAEAALDAGMDENNILQFENSAEAGRYIQNIIAPGDIILVKGSQSMRMERVVAELMRYPELREKLLVRQDPQWLAKK